MITRKAAPALATGCTMVLKPAEQTPLTALALAALAERAEIPAGVFNVVIGDAREIGGEFTRNPLVRKITFTGSTEVGPLLLTQSAATVKKVSMELGGNAPCLVFDDGDPVEAAAGVVATKYRNTGQACISANRIYVQEGVHDAFVANLIERVAKLRVGAGFDHGVQQEPLIDEDGVAKVEAPVDSGGRAPASPRRPVLRADSDHRSDPAMLICREETFGPIAPIIRFRDEAEAVRMANGTEFGLAAYCSRGTPPAFGESRPRWRPAWSASTPGSSPMNSRHSAG
jgi:succinate-semialdehyde dehydrogenase/glutarate-semialdehyde dehydrogenase